MLRLIRHLFTPYWFLHLRFRKELLEQIAERIRVVEQRHPGELRFAVEHALEIGDLLIDKVTPRQRALELFGLLRVWDTELNTGVLIYVLVADRAVEVVADRGIARAVPQADWDALCRTTESLYREGRYADGSTAIIEGAARLLEQYFPPGPAGRNELPNQPLLL